MSAAEGNAGASLSSASLADLRRDWESGRQARCLRSILDGWDGLSGSGSDLRWLEGVLRSSGLLAEAFAVRVRAAREQGADAREWAAVVRSVLQSGDPWWAAELLREAACRSRELDALNIEVQLAIGDAAEAIAAWQCTYDDDAAHEAALQWWLRCGRIAEVERLAEQTPSLAVWRARLAIWRNQPERALPLIDALPPTPAASCLRAIAAVLQGRLPDAEATLRTLLDGEAQAEAWSWLATALRLQARYAEAGRAAQTATTLSPRFNLVLWMERMLAAAYGTRGARRAAIMDGLRSVLAAVGLARRRRMADLDYAASLYPLGARPEQSVRDLAAVIARFGGNHSADLTIVDGGTLRSYPLPPDPQQLGVSIQLVLRTRGVEATRALYRQLAPSATGPRYRLYQGETELWMGDYAEAARIFRAILAEQRDMKWAWIGLGASAMLQGEPREAQQIWRQGLRAAGCAGPTLLVYRGECHRRQGQHDEARRDLERAVLEKPQRLSAWINLALLRGEPDLLARVERECIELMPMLMGELRGDVAQRLEGVLDAMRGNRGSSRITYHLWGRVWHFMTRPFDAAERQTDPRPAA